MAKGLRGWVPMVAAATAFAAVVAAFGFLVTVLRTTLERDARRNLDARAELAARTLEEPLRTQDYGAIRAFADDCRKAGVDFRIASASGGTLFDTRGAAAAAGADELASVQACGESRLVLYQTRDVVIAPYRRALVLFALAALIGVLGMLVVFFSSYRQRVRIRELKRLEEFRRTFIADVSHEIKTPLTGIIGAVDALTETEDAAPELRRRLLGMAKKSAVRLDGLVRSILDLARLERAGSEPERAETDLGALVAEVVEELGAEAGRAGVTVKVVAPPEPPTAYVDARLVATAVSNLIVNAVRHSGAGEVRVVLSADDRVARVAVEDSGVGIAPEHRARIFERFYRVDAARSDGTGGSGLGLAIVRRIAELHGGTAVCEPVEPRGVRFTLAFSKIR